MPIERLQHLPKDPRRLALELRRLATEHAHTANELAALARLLERQDQAEPGLSDG
jgi:hypothetical protein